MYICTVDKALILQFVAADDVPAAGSSRYFVWPIQTNLSLHYYSTFYSVVFIYFLG